MKKISFLFLDHNAQKHEIQQVLCDLKNLSLLDFVEKIKQKEVDDLSSQIDSIIRTSAVLPTSLLDEFILYHLNTNRSDNILISEYPKKYNQFEDFVKKLEKAGMVVNAVFYIKHRDVDRYMQDYFSTPKNYAWLYKYGDEVILKWKEEFYIKRILINELMIKYNNLVWRIIEMEYCANSPEVCIRTQLAEGL